MRKMSWNKKKIVSLFFFFNKIFFVCVWNCWTLRLQIQISLEIYGLVGEVRSIFLVKLASFLILEHQNGIFFPSPLSL